MKDIVIQAIGFVAMGFAFVSFQQKSQRKVLIFQLIANCIFIFHYGLLGAVMGAILNGLSALRSLLFSLKEKHDWAKSTVWIYVLSLLFLSSYVLCFTAFKSLPFGKEPTAKNLIIEFIPIIGSTIQNVTFYQTSSKKIRRLYIISIPFWLVYNIIHLAIGGMISDCVSLSSAIIGYFRHDRKRIKETEETINNQKNTKISE